MFKKIKNVVVDAFNARVTILGILMIIFGFIIVRRLFELQIINGDSYQSDFTMQIRKTVTIPSTRGNIYDSKGNLLAYNQLSYNVTFQDVGTYESNREKNLTINGYLYKIMQILYENGDDVYTDFAIAKNDAGEYEYTKSGVNLLRFKADIFGQAYTEDLTKEEREITAEDLVKTLGSEKYYGVLVDDYTEKELAAAGLPSAFSDEDALKLIALRSAINQNSYQKYISTTIAKSISNQSMSSLMESKGYYIGVDVEEGYDRIYTNSPYMSNILGYTGQISNEEISALNEQLGQTVYDSSDIVGKSGLEQHFETQLQGIDGSKVVYVNNLGKVLKEDSQVEPQAGNDIYLTINTEYQEAAYHLLEQYIAGILYQHTYDYKEFDNTQVSTDEIIIPVYDMYYAMFSNNILSVTHMESADATNLEKEVYASFQKREKEIFAEIKSELLADDPKPYSELSEQMQVYISYLLDTTMPEVGLLKSDSIDTTDAMYQQWAVDESISLKEYLTYAISQEWMDITQITSDSEFLNSSEIFSSMTDYLEEYIQRDSSFSKLVYRYMVEDDLLMPNTLCMLLFDQGILEADSGSYNALADGSMDAYSFILQKIYNLEIAPSQFALAPCSGSLVLTDPNTGKTLACVTYPGYDNNRLANDMDDDYFASLVTDGSSPFYNKATQELTAPGSTYKMVTATAGLMEGVVTAGEAIDCTGTFSEVKPPINCWIGPTGSHGPLTLVSAIQESCNFYFNTVGFRLGMIGSSTGESVDEIGISMLEKYASMYGFDQETGIEMDESTPHISDNAVAPSAMGQGRNAYATAQLARYVGTIANGGTCYDLTLVDKITDADGRSVVEKQPVVHDTVEVDQESLNTIQTGMNQMVKNSAAIRDIEIDMAGKTGTAEETGVPSHALFVGYAPYDSPQVAIAVRITNGYNSANAAMLAKDMIRYVFNLKEKDQIITGVASSGTTTAARTD
ncbi:MAG: penicillin-binding transpeptidase domain-containing protein [Eubacteriales bacterium]|nr:penicillin-binding transpeptidase domain-containing protein [Eubacteriales bacterium]